MGRRSQHYEAAFESYLRARGWPYVLVDEAKKSVFASVSIKSFDFLVYSNDQANMLVDVKGRKFPARSAPSARRWENWITRDDVESLLEWENIFGPEFVAVLVFAYWLQGPPQEAPFEDVHFFRQRHYAFATVRLQDYVQAAGPRSAKWQTITMPTAEFCKGITDIAGLL